MPTAAPVTETDREALVLKHYPLVRAIAGRVYQRLPKAIDLDDLISAGVTGLLEAVDRYDPDRAVPFETYAKHRIHGAVVDALRHADWVPRSVRRKGDRIADTKRSLKRELGREPTRRELAKAFQVTPRKYDAMVTDSAIRPLLSLDAPMGEGNPTPLVEQVPGTDDPTRTAHKQELRQALLEALPKLPERERTAISLYYLHELALKEVGEVLGVTESRACQLCGQGIKRLRTKLRRYIA